MLPIQRNRFQVLGGGGGPQHRSHPPLGPDTVKLFCHVRFVAPQLGLSDRQRERFIRLIAPYDGTQVDANWDAPVDAGNLTQNALGLDRTGHGSSTSVLPTSCPARSSLARNFLVFREAECFAERTRPRVRE